MKQARRLMCVCACALAVGLTTWNAGAQSGTIGTDYSTILEAIQHNVKEIHLPPTISAWHTNLPFALNGISFIGDAPNHPELVRIAGNVNLGNTDVTFEGITLTGGVTIGEGCTAQFRRCYIRRNTTGENPGILCTGQLATVLLENCSLSGNPGDGVHATSGNLLINFCTIVGNQGYGILAENDANVIITNSIVAENTLKPLHSTGSVPISGGYNDINPPAMTNYVTTGNDVYTPPKLATNAAWLGKLGAAAGVGEMATPGITPLVDFEGDPRPSGLRADIGADEFPYIGHMEFPTWHLCAVTSASSATGSPTAIGTGSFTVTITFSEVPLFPTVREVACVPQGGLLLNPADRIAWTKVESTVSDQLVTLTCTSEPLTTCAILNGHLVDGYATVYLILDDGSVVRPVDTSIVPQGSWFVNASAATGGRFLIDTVPPVRLDSLDEPATSETEFTADDLIALHNNPAYAARGVSFGDRLTHPYAALGTDTRQYAPELDAVNHPSHATFTIPLPGQPLQVFLNVGSFANNYENGTNGADRHKGLNVGFTAQFQDIDAVTFADKAGIAVDHNDTDEWDNNTVRPVAGFGTNTPQSMSGTQETLQSSTLPVYASGLPDATIVATETITGADYDVILADWGFGSDGLDVPPSGSLDVNVSFSARDRTGNKSSDPVNVWNQANVPALRVWWLRGGTDATHPADQLVAPISLENIPGTFPTLKWALSRPGLNNIQFDEGPKPLYTYRVYGKAPQDDLDHYPNYVPISEWHPWGNSDQEMAIRASGFETLQASLTPPDTLYDRSLIVVVGTCDEAGNVFPWGATGLPFPDASGDIAPPSAEVGPNWRRFYIPAESKAIDTRLTANFVQGTNSLGQVTTMTSSDYGRPDELQAEFTIGLSVPDSNELNISKVEVELLEDGRRVFIGDIWGRSNPDDPSARMPDAQRTIKIPQDLYPTVTREEIQKINTDTSLEATLTNSRLGHPDTPGVTPADGKNVDYVFRATTVYRHLDATNGYYQETRDASPAAIAFKVIRQPIEQYLETPSGKQPTKVFERE